MNPERLADLALHEVEMFIHANTVLDRLIDAIAREDYASVLIDLTEAHAAFQSFSPCKWWER